MATTVEPRSKTHTPESRFVLYGVGWRGYEALLNLIGDRPIRGWPRLLQPGSRSDERSLEPAGLDLLRLRRPGWRATRATRDAILTSPDWTNGICDEKTDKLR
jgi:hypothetical protein